MKFNLSISRNSKNRVGIEVKCDSSRVMFLNLDLSLEEYAQIITGLSHVEVEGTVRGLEFVGKTKITEGRTTTISKDSYNYDKKFAQQYLIDNCQEEGWILNAYVGSQDSVVFDHKEQVYKVKYSVYKYVDIAE